MLNTAVLKISLPKWNIEEFCGYKPITTFWQDFSIADRFGIAAVKDTYNRAFKEWKHDYKYLTELTMVLNHKIWQHKDTNRPLALVYNELYDKAAQYAESHLKGKQLDYYYEVTD